METLIDTGGERVFWVVILLILGFIIIGVINAFTHMSIEKERLFQENYKRHIEGGDQVIEGEIIRDHMNNH